MKADHGAFHLNPLSRLGFLALLLAVSTAAGLVVSWRAPGLELTARTWLLRMRGTLPPSEQLVIVAIDEASLAQLGRHPWPRRVLAQALDQLSAAHPQVLALDVLYPESTNETDDAALASAIRRAGNVVVATQLTEAVNAQGEAANVWLRPWPAIAQAAAGVGHANVVTGFDGVVRSLLLRMTDDEAAPYWALALETLRVGAGLSPAELREVPDGVQLGPHFIPASYATALGSFSGQPAAVETWRAAQLGLDFAGPAGSFAAQTVSFQEVLAGRVAPERLRGKYVLLGATAAALGDRVASPFTRAAAGTAERAAFMPGVEVLANALNTLLQRRFYREPAAALTALLAALTAAATALALSLAQGRYEAVKHLLALAVLPGAILFGSYLAFTYWLCWPPLVPVLTAWLVAAPLSLLQRSLTLSASLDRRIAAISQVGAELLAAQPQPHPQPFPHWPRGGAWKARQLGDLAGQLADRVQFVEQALRAVEDGLLIADLSGRITFANRRAAEILGRPAHGWQSLAGADLGESLAEAAPPPQLDKPELRRRLLTERLPHESELTLPAAAGPRHYLLRLAPVLDAAGHTVLGLVASLADITKHYELQAIRNDVLALVTHELKTPLTAIQAMSEVLAQYEVDAPRRREMHLAINDEAKRLAALIDEYLSLTRLETGAQRIRLAPVRPAPWLERTLLLLEPLAAQRGIQLVRHVAGALPVLQADAAWLARAFTNLVANALKFSPPQSTVRVSAYTVAGEFCLEVADQGCGIPTTALPHVFEKFYRVPQTPSGEDEVPGHGLGLALVREIAEQHGGRVTVESEFGAGSVFRLWLPVADAGA